MLSFNRELKHATTTATVSKASLKKSIGALSNFIALVRELSSKGQYLSLKKEKENRCLAFTLSMKREIKKFHVVVVQRRQRNVQKYLMQVQSCCFAYLSSSIRRTGYSVLLRGISLTCGGIR